MDGEARQPQIVVVDVQNSNLNTDAGTAFPMNFSVRIVFWNITNTILFIFSRSGLARFFTRVLTYTISSGMVNILKK